jgi:hypothetical protein
LQPGVGPDESPRALPECEQGAARLAAWETIFLRASPARRAELLDLARRHGVLSAHQLPALTNGPAAPAQEEGRQFLVRILAGHTDELAPVRPDPLELWDAALDAAQREAVAGAVCTPDLFLLQGLPGTGKSRVVAEIVTQAAARGDRILLLAPTAAAIDRVLELVADRDVISPVRCLGPGEAPEALPPCSRPLTFAERVRHLGEYPLQGARRDLAAGEQRSSRLRLDGPVYDRLAEIAEEQERLEAEAEALRQRRAQVPADVEREAVEAESAPAVGGRQPFAVAIAAQASARNAVREAAASRLDELHGQMANRRKELEGRASWLADVRPLAEARRRWAMWKVAWWRSLRYWKPNTNVSKTEAMQEETAAVLGALGEEAGRLTFQQEEAERAFQAERAKHLAAEVAHRRAELDDQETALRRAQELLRDKARNASRELARESPPPADLTPAAVRAARVAWGGQLEREGEQAAFTCRCVAALEEAAPGLAARLPDVVNLVAATTTGLPQDDHFGDASPHATAFDLLVLQDADQVTESEFLALARRARRWVLVGEAAAEMQAGSAKPAPRRTPGPQRPVALRPASLRPGFFQRLWQHLVVDPRRLPYAWVQDKDRLCCRLLDLAPEQRQWLQSEPVADSPDIELRILAPPDAGPVLAEVLFPPSMSIFQAKAFIFRELEQLPVRAVGPAFQWLDAPEQVALLFTDTPSSAAVPIPLESGVREMVVSPHPEANGRGPAPATWSTCRIEFDKKAGWHKARAEAWARRYLGVRDPGRTARLDVPHRMHPELAGFLSEMLFAGAYQVADQATGSATAAGCGRNGYGSCVEFVPVPAAVAGDKKKKDRGHRARESAGTPAAVAFALPKGGAGLELDLADRRHRDRLPSELRPDLPEHGYVNYLEAQAVVRALESLAAEPGAWRADRALGTDGQRPVVGALALYPAQVELIRRLVRQAPALAGCAFDLKIDVPAAFREHECAVVLLSLTRSHLHRAVTYGEGPQALTLALTRARARLILFADPGTLLRRTQWDGPLDHLDEAAAGRERDVIAHLVRYLQGEGPRQRAFHLCEACGP